MEFFERAHVVKIDMGRKEKKSEAIVKKQLKQMLDGYKCSNNKVIKEAGSEQNRYDDLVGGLDDSTSVSGFSDLNLTNSSMEGDKMQNISTNDSVHSNIGKTKSNNSSDELKESAEFDSDSISDFNEGIESLTENTNETANSISSASEKLSLSEIEWSKSSDYSSSDIEFDQNGELASKILTRLLIKDPKKSKRDNKKLAQIVDNNDALDVPLESVDSDSEIKESDSDTLSFSQDSSTVSSPFVSISAEDMADQNLSEIIGDYRYSTVKNLPSDKQNAITDSSLFCVPDVDSATVKVEEDVDSLIPEIGEEQTVEDLDMTDVDFNLQEQDNVSTTVMDDTIQLEESTGIQNSTQSVELDHVKSFKIYYGRNICILVMKHPSKIYINGKVKIKALGGTVEVFGYTLKDQFCDLYAPNYNCAQCITTVEAQNIYCGLFGKLTFSGLSVEDAEEIVITIGEHDAVIGLSALSSRTMDFVENNFKIVDLFSKQNKNIESYFKKVTEIIRCTLYSVPPIKCYEVNSSWQEVISCGNDYGSRTLVCGGKGSGKSTFVRYFVNKLLPKGPVLVIDLDPGQAEFTVAGHVSATVVTEPLLGPNFTHLSSPDLMLNIGMISTMDNPFRYINAVAELIIYCCGNNMYKTMPWVINTMGMTNNIGIKFITLIIMNIQPTFVLQIDSKHPKNRFEVELHPDMVKKLFNNFGQDKLFKNVTYFDLNYKFLLCSYRDSDVSTKLLSPRDERYLNFLAYFGELLNSHSGSTLLDIIPYQVKLCNLNIGLNVKIPQDVVAKVINGKIIALCQLSTTDKGKVFVLGDYAVRCLGHGLIRGVDFENGVLYVITPVAVDILPSVNTLVYSDWVPDLKGEERNLPKGTVVPYRAVSAHKQNKLMRAPHRRFNPLQLFKVARNTKLKSSVIS